jgi:hypothetical protein
VKNNNRKNVNEKELDLLLNEVFLKLDGQNVLSGSEALELFAEQAMKQNRLGGFISGRKWNMLFLFFSLLIFLNSLLHVLRVHSDNDIVVPSPLLHDKKINIASEAPRTIDFIKMKDEESMFSKKSLHNKKIKARSKKINLYFSNSEESKKSFANTWPPDAPTGKTNDAQSRDRSLIGPSAGSIQMQPVALTPAKKVREDKPEKTTSTVKRSRKGLFSWIRKKRIARRNGTFMLRSGKYGKRQN